MTRLPALPRLAAAALCAALPAAATAQERQPPAVYWMSIATDNLALPGIGAEAGLAAALMGQSMPGGGPQRSLLLQLGSPRAPAGAPRAEHEIPPGLNLGRSLPLTTPEREAPRARREAGAPPEQEPPRARLLIYWGCGAEVRSGQPYGVDTARMSSAEFGKALAGRAVSQPLPPAPDRARTYGDWPSARDAQPIPRDASLAGGHLVRGNYLPDIRFELDAKHDFMAPVQLSVSSGRGEAQSVGWNAVPNATAYFATAMGSAQKSGDMIVWSSSEVREPGWALMDYLPNAEVQRLLREKVLMPPEILRCTVPRGIFKDADGAMLRLIAYGEELNLAQPPRPTDPKQPWNPIWTAKIRVKSTGMIPLDGGGAERTAPGRETPSRGAAQPGGAEPAEAAKPTDPAGQVIDGVRRLKGLFGF